MSICIPPRPSIHPSSRLIPISYVPGHSSINGQWSPPYWVCRCSCGSTVKLRTAKLHGRRATLSCGCLKAELYTLRAKAIAEGNTAVRLDFFDTWTPDSAYVLGYIWADGNIISGRCGPTGIHFCCTARDADLLQAIADAMGCTRRLTWRKPRIRVMNGKTYHCAASAELRVFSTIIARQLVDRHGIPCRKSFRDPPFPENIPNNMLAHFARGNLDGDGSILVSDSRRRAVVQFLGSPQFISGLARRIVIATGVSSPSPSFNHTLQIARWCSKADILTLKKWLYQDTGISLARKRAEFDRAANILADVKGKSFRTRPGGVKAVFPATSALRL